MHSPDETFTRLVTNEFGRHGYAMRQMSLEATSFSALRHCEEIAHHDRMMQYASALVADWAKLQKDEGLAIADTESFIKMSRFIENEAESLDQIKRKLFPTRRYKTDADQRFALLPAIVAATCRIFAHQPAGDCDVNPYDIKW
jgi:hypothetical protein